MDGFIFFLIFIFVIVPIIKNISVAYKKKIRSQSNSTGKPAQKDWTQVQKLLQEKVKAQAQNKVFGKKNAHGHSDDRQNTHARLHAGDQDSNVFTDSHANRVKKREQRDRSERNRIEAKLHGASNRAIYRDGNKSLDGWGARGEAISSNGWLFLIIFALIALVIISQMAPDLWLNIRNTLNF